jgi:glucose-1-phosphate thymidylyltransferase
MPLKTGVCLCGGKGSRLSPQTEIHNKHLLPVYTHQGAIPMVWYSLNTLISSGCDKIIIISSQEHCGDIMQFLGDGRRFGKAIGRKIDICYKIQDHNNPVENPLGIASALRLVETAVDTLTPFMVILGDNLYEESFYNEFDTFCNNYYSNAVKSSNPNDTNVAHIFLKEVSDISRFGCATLEGNRVTKIVEKPINPESNFAVSGLYFYTSHIFSLLPNLTPSRRGEIEISDINQWYVENNGMTSTIIKGFWHDLGTIPSMLYATDWINKNRFTIPLK